MRGVHYLNQFFGGVGAEEQAGMSLEVRDDGAMGPGKLLEQLLGGGAPVIITLVCGDNYAVEHEEELIASVLEKVRAALADLFVANLASKRAVMAWRLEPSALPSNRSWLFPLLPG